MILATREESLEIDRQSLAQWRGPSDHFMENAGRRMAEWIRIHATELDRFLFLCGPGNNGGDAYVVARELKVRGYEKITIFAENSGSTSELNRQKKSEAEKLGIEVRNILDLSDLEVVQMVAQSDCLVDGVFGSGLNREIEGPWSRICDLVTQHSRFTVSLDIPTGLDSNTGMTYSHFIKAHCTLGVRPFKPGFYLNRGPGVCGSLYGIDVGFDSVLVSEVAKSVRLIGFKSFAKLRPKRKWNSNKTHFGNLLVIGGSQGMEGAAILASLAALRSGAGYVTLASDSTGISRRVPPDVLCRPLKKVSEVLRDKKVRGVVVGPGLDPSVGSEMYSELEKSGLPTVVDAGALAWLAQQQNKRLPKNWIITPHAGELSKILALDSESIEEDRLRAANLAVEKTGAVVVLKGFHTVVQSEKKSYIINSGNPALAKSGTGDVLAGLIGSFLAQNLDPVKSAAAAAYMHGDLADRWIRGGHTKSSLMASDLVELMKDY